MRSSVIFGLFLVFTITCLAPGLVRAKAVHYQYKGGENETLSYWFSKHGVQMDFKRGKTTQHILYNTGEDALYTYESSEGSTSSNQGSSQAPTAQKITRQEMESLAAKLQAQMDKMQEQMDKLPPAQRKQMKQMMGGMKSPEKTTQQYETTFEKTAEGRWNGMDAVKGDVLVGGEKKAEAVMVKSPPVDVADEQLEGLKGLRSLFTKMMGTLTALPGGKTPQSVQGDAMSGQFFLGPQQLRLVEYVDPDKSYKLVEWNQGTPPNPNFKPPENYKIRSIGGQ